MASRLVNNYRGKMGILSITFVHTRAIQMRRNCQRHNVEGIPQDELTQLQHPWYLSDFIIYSPNTSTEFYGNKHCVPNMVKLVT
jgi:hypothetical protein